MLDDYKLNRSKEMLERASFHGLLDFSDPMDMSKFHGNVYADTRGMKVAEIRELAKHYGARKVPTGRMGAVRTLAAAYAGQIRANPAIEIECRTCRGEGGGMSSVDDTWTCPDCEGSGIESVDMHEYEIYQDGISIGTVTSYSESAALYDAPDMLKGGVDWDADLEVKKISSNPAGQIERLEIHDSSMPSGLFKSQKREVRGYSDGGKWFYEDGTPIETKGVRVTMIKGYRDNPSDLSFKDWANEEMQEHQHRSNPSVYESQIRDPEMKPKKVGTRIAKVLRTIKPKPTKVTVRKVDAGWPRGWDYSVYVVVDVQLKGKSEPTGIAFNINVAEDEASGTANADRIGIVSTARSRDPNDVIERLSRDVRDHFSAIMSNPYGDDRKEITPGGHCHCGADLPDVYADEIPYEFCSAKCKRESKSRNPYGSFARGGSPFTAKGKRMEEAIAKKGSAEAAPAVVYSAAQRGVPGLVRKKWASEHGYPPEGMTGNPMYRDWQTSLVAAADRLKGEGWKEEEDRFTKGTTGERRHFHADRGALEISKDPYGSWSMYEAGSPIAIYSQPDLAALVDQVLGVDTYGPSGSRHRANPSEIHFDGSEPKLSESKTVEFLEGSLGMNGRDAKIAAGMMSESEDGKTVWGERHGREYRMGDSDILRWINDHADDGHGMHGVEAIYEDDEGEISYGHGSILAEYINTGDMYSPTVLVESVGPSKFYLTTLGDWRGKIERENTTEPDCGCGNGWSCEVCR